MVEPSAVPADSQRRELLQLLLHCVRAASGADRAIDNALFALGWGCSTPIHGAARQEFDALDNNRFTGSIDAARGLHRFVLPDFWITSGLCGHTGHASTGPDYNGRNGEALRAKWPVAKFDGGFHADLAPGDGPHRECLAILDVTLQAIIAQTEPQAASDPEPLTAGGDRE